MKTLIFGAALTAAFAGPLAADIIVKDAYARSAGAKAIAGAAFMEIENTGTEADRLISATAGDVSKRVELHTHKDMGDGVMKMMEVEEGFEIPAGSSHMLMRGGDHVMFMGLNDPWEQGDMLHVTLTFEKAGEMMVMIPVDLDRQDGHGMSHGAMDHSDDHSGHKHGD